MAYFKQVFNFTELPSRLLLYIGIAGMSISILFATILIGAKLHGDIPVPGYTPIVLAIMFFGGLTSLGLGILGQYLWLCLQDSRNGPTYVVASKEEFPADQPEASKSSVQQI